MGLNETGDRMFDSPEMIIYFLKLTLKRKEMVSFKCSIVPYPPE